MTTTEQHSGTHIVAIDGPAGAGKSSVSRQVARELGFAFLDTGAMYRAATWRALTNVVPLDDTPALVASTCEMALDLREEPDGLQVFVAGREVTRDIRSPEVTRNTFRLDKFSGVPGRTLHLPCRLPRYRSPPDAM